MQVQIYFNLFFILSYSYNDLMIINNNNMEIQHSYTGHTYTGSYLENITMVLYGR